jgi:hypothetical protein
VINVRAHSARSARHADREVKRPSGASAIELAIRLRDLRGTTKDSRLCSAAERGDLQRFTGPDRVRIRVRDERVAGRKAGGRLRQNGQQKMPICR